MRGGRQSVNRHHEGQRARKKIPKTIAIPTKNSIAMAITAEICGTGALVVAI